MLLNEQRDLYTLNPLLKVHKGIPVCSNPKKDWSTVNGGREFFLTAPVKKEVEYLQINSNKKSMNVLKAFKSGSVFTKKA